MRLMSLIVTVFLSLVLMSCGPAEDQTQTDILSDFDLNFTVLIRDDDPDMRLRKSGISGVDYNVPTWVAYDPENAEFIGQARTNAQGGDGFDDRILEKSPDGRTANLYHAGREVEMTPSNISREGDVIIASFEPQETFELSAQIELGGAYPKLSWDIKTKTPQYISVVYTGAASLPTHAVDEVWQPLIWTEKRIPDRPYLTASFRTPLPTAFVRRSEAVTGVLATPDKLPFDPLPVLDNSQFGIAVRTQDGLAPQLIAPIMGGYGSKMEPGESRQMSAFLIRDKAKDITQTYEMLARDIYRFDDYRQNAIASTNTALDNIVDYGLSQYSRFNQDLRGYSYATDVPGAVKNVSSLSALSLALSKDLPEMMEARAIPLVEYMLSREKFLFSLDPEQKIQSPSRALLGPVAPVSELTALADILPASEAAFLDLAKEEFKRDRERNLTLLQRGDTWQNSLALYRVTGNESDLERAISGADIYISERLDNRPTDFSQPGLFFWTAFAPDFAALYELWEVTDEERFLEAAQLSARLFALHIWVAPSIPEEMIRVNPEGKAPLYWYLASKGHRQMMAEPEDVPAWRLSEIGLTPESSGTSSGHRAIFMANYAPWLLRIGDAAKDEFLTDLARSSIIGRYRNFPGYHINTARTTVYEKADYPLRAHKDLSVNSFHYNHVLPMASFLLDWLVSEAYVKSEGEVSFPSQYVEGYAYLKNKIYGHDTGRFYGFENVRLWMPARLATFDTVEVNYVSGLSDEGLFLALTNESAEPVDALMIIDPARLTLDWEAELEVLSVQGQASWGEDGQVSITLPPRGFLALRLPVDQAEQALDMAAFSAKTYKTPLIRTEAGDTRAYILSYGEQGQRIYMHTRDDDSAIRAFTVDYKSAEGDIKQVIDQDYPFEFDLDLPATQAGFDFKVSVETVGGDTETSEWLTLQ